MLCKDPQIQREMNMTTFRVFEMPADGIECNVIKCTKLWISSRWCWELSNVKMKMCTGVWWHTVCQIYVTKRTHFPIYAFSRFFFFMFMCRSDVSCTECRYEGISIDMEAYMLVHKIFWPRSLIWQCKMCHHIQFQWHWYVFATWSATFHHLAYLRLNWYNSFDVIWTVLEHLNWTRLE